MIFSRLRWLLAVAAIVVAEVAQAADEYADVLHTRNANRGIAMLRSMADGCHYTTCEGNSIYRHSYARRGEKERLLAVDFKVADYTFSPDEQRVLLSDAASVKPIYRHSATADYWLADVKGAAECVLRGVRDVSFTPDGRRLLYAKENNLYIYDISSRSESAITQDGRWNEVINGTSDWVYEEEYGFTRAYAISPDGGQVAYLRFDERRVPLFEMMRYDNSLYNKAYTFKYPKAGDKNSKVELWLYDLAAQSGRKVDTGECDDQYIFNLGWTPAGELYFYRVNRLQNHFEVLLLRRDGTQRVIYDERSPRYVERPNGSTISFVDGERFVVREETTTGYMHLYLHSVSKGRIRPLTAGKWEVAQVVAVTPKSVYLLSTERSPLNRDLVVCDYRGRCRRLTSQPGFYSVQPSCGAKFYVQSFTNVDTPNVITVHRADGSVVDTLADRRADVAATGRWARKEFRQFTTERGDTLNYYVQLPEDFDASKRYPVLLTQYSGPGSQSVRNRWSLDWEDAMVRKGYIVACCDGRGTGFRGEAFKKVTYADLGRKEVEDQLSFARYLVSQSWVDAERIGIYGWSYGGFMALNCALHGEGLFRMAIAVAPVTSWRYYDTIYTEIYNGLPQDNPKGYDDNSPLYHAAKLSPRTRLLIIHGTADDNVHFQNSMEMCRRLNEAGKQYDMMVYPDQNHSMRPSATSLVRQKMIDYTTKNL
ncbi:MAG: DPP IV N-terminal domain-containing protein [Alistipes sp.]|nr:DPP IV N-terminal domain-containing protein [Alistipes sp.]